MTSGSYAVNSGVNSYGVNSAVNSGFVGMPGRVLRDDMSAAASPKPPSLAQSTAAQAQARPPKEGRPHEGRGEAASEAARREGSNGKEGGKEGGERRREEGYRASRPTDGKAADSEREEVVEKTLDVLLELYGIAPPWGLALVCSSGASSVAKFASKHTTLFRERTTRVVHMGGADLVRTPANQSQPNLAILARADLQNSPAVEGSRSVLGTRCRPRSPPAMRRQVF